MYTHTRVRAHTHRFILLLTSKKSKNLKKRKEGRWEGGSGREGERKGGREGGRERGREERRMNQTRNSRNHGKSACLQSVLLILILDWCCTFIWFTSHVVSTLSSSLLHHSDSLLINKITVFAFDWYHCCAKLDYLPEQTSSASLLCKAYSSIDARCIIWILRIFKHDFQENNATSDTLKDNYLTIIYFGRSTLRIKSNDTLLTRETLHIYVTSLSISRFVQQTPPLWTGAFILHEIGPLSKVEHDSLVGA